MIDSETLQGNSSVGGSDEETEVTMAQEQEEEEEPIPRGSNRRGNRLTGENNGDKKQRNASLLKRNQTNDMPGRRRRIPQRAPTLDESEMPTTTRTSRVARRGPGRRVPERRATDSEYKLSSEEGGNNNNNNSNNSSVGPLAIMEKGRRGYKLKGSMTPNDGRSLALLKRNVTKDMPNRRRRNPSSSSSNDDDVVE